MSKVLDHIYQVIGNTPMVRLNKIAEHHGVEGEILAKLEYLSPGFSKKDRPALQIIKEAEASGQLKPGQTVVELTSGNMGTGLSIVCSGRGYPFVACMSEGNSPERARMMRALGAEVVLVKQVNGKPGMVTGEDLAQVELVTQKITEERGAFRADQFTLPGSYNGHRLHTAREIWEQANGAIEAFADFAGSGGTFVGCAQGLKAYNPMIRCYLVEPETGARYAKLPIRNNGQHQIQGGGYNMALPILDSQDEKLIDGFIQISDEEAVAAARDLARLEGIFAGFSSGANVMAAIKLLRGKEKGKAIAILLPDSGLKYLSTNLY